MSFNVKGFGADVEELVVDFQESLTESLEEHIEDEEVVEELVEGLVEESSELIKATLRSLHDHEGIEKSVYENILEEVFDDLDD